MAKAPTAKKAAKKTSKTGSRKGGGARRTPAFKPTRSSSKDVCRECGASSGMQHSEDCPNGHCLECKGTLGHMLTCSQHESRRPVLDGKTGAVIETTVDGKEAKIDTSARPKPKPKPKPKAGTKGKGKPADDDENDDGSESGLKRLPPPKITDPALFEAIQYGIDKKIIFGIKQPLTKSKRCDVEWFDQESQQSVGCAGSAVFDFEKLDTCTSCKHTSKHVIKSECIAHMALDIAGELKDRQISIFEPAE